MHQQLKVPTDRCPAVANRLLDAKLQCPLGGDYVLHDADSSKDLPGWWKSTAWQSGSLSQRGKPKPPADYIAPLVEWFRGGKVQAIQQASSLSVVGLIQLELPPLPVETGESADPIQLPKLDFDIFSLPLKMFGKGAAASKDSADPQAPAPVKKQF
jgi:hypothetical protein